jgi:signal transduction histidine kinase
MADWFAISMRWIALVGLVVSLGLAGQLKWETVWPLIILIGWNLGMTAFAGMNSRLKFHRPISLAVDLILTGAFFEVQGGLNGPAFWAVVLPIINGAIFYELWGALIAAVLISMLLIISTAGSQGNLSLAIAVGFSFYLLAFLFGLLGHSLIISIRRNRQNWHESEDRKHRVQTERLRALYELTSTLAATLSYKRVLDSALEMGASALNPNPGDGAMDQLVAAVLLFKGGRLKVGASRRFTNADKNLDFDGGEGILKRLFDEGAPLLTDSINTDPELGRIIALRNSRSSYNFPLRSGFNVYGALLFAHPSKNFFTADRRDILDIISHQAVIAIQNARLYQDLVEEKERMIEVHEEARKKLARDLHDGPTQSVSAIAMRIDLARRMITKDVSAASEELAKLEQLAQRTTKEIRHMLFTLRPLILESQGLTAALKAMADKLNETYDQKLTIQVDERVAGQLEMGKQGVIFYIVEEAVNNARKHAHANTIGVKLQAMDSAMALLEIADDGVGFDVKTVMRGYDDRASSSLGMTNLRERTELVNGLLQIDSAPGQGTRVQVFIPLTEEAAERLHTLQKQ